MRASLRWFVRTAAIFLLVSVAGVRAQGPSHGQIVKLDPGLDAALAPDSPIELVVDGIPGEQPLSEGPVWTRDGSLLFGETAGNVIYKVTADGTLSVFREHSGWDGPTPPGYFRLGTPGLSYDKQGRLIMLEEGNRRVTRLESDGRVTVLADKYEGKRLNRPNDLAVKSDGSIYFTDPQLLMDPDPKLGRPMGCIECAKELGYHAVFRIVDGKVQLLTRDINPNGIAFSPDEQYLYLTNGRKWMRYDVKPDGTLGSGSVFFDLDTTDQKTGSGDGMKTDLAGNLIGSGPRGIWIISPGGRALGRIETPGSPRNVGWGGADGKWLYMTAGPAIYRVRFKTGGKRPCCDPS